jgi:hypothetical protein
MIKKATFWQQLLDLGACLDRFEAVDRPQIMFQKLLKGK